MSGYVIKGDIGTKVGVLWPADKCSFESDNLTAGGYAITNAAFYPGTSVVIGGESASAEHTVLNPELGYLGKSGRFVQLAK